MRFFALSILLFILTMGAFGETTEINDLLDRVSAARSSGNYEAAAAELLSFEAAEAEAFRENNLDYLLARIDEENGDLASAMVRYHSVRSRSSKLSEYALWRMSRIAAASGNLIFERILLSELKAFYPSSLLFRAAARRTSLSFFESSDFASAARTIESFASRSKGAEPLGRVDMVYLARSYLYLNDTVRASELFASAINSTPDAAQPDDLALEGVRGLDLLERGVSPDDRRIPQVSEAEHIRRGWIYQFNRDFVQGRDHYQAVINEHPTSAFAPEAVLQLGRGYAQEGNFTDATSWFERLIEQYPEHPLAKDALLQAASAYGRNGKFRESLGRYQRFIDQYPSDDRLDRAYFNPIDTLRDENSEGEALRRAAVARERFSGRVGEAQALFVEARIHIARKEWEKALDSLDLLLASPDLGGTRVPGGTDGTEAGFLRAYVLEKLQRFGDSIDGYLAIPDGRDAFYGWRATERLRALRTTETSRPAAENRLAVIRSQMEAGDVEARRLAIQKGLRLAEPAEIEELLGELRGIYSQLPEYRSVPQPAASETVEKAISALPPSSRHSSFAATLHRLGINDEAAAEFDAAENSNQASSALYTESDKVFRSLESVEPLWRNVPADFQVELIPSGAASAFYAAPFRRHLIRHATEQKVDPRFLLAIMRQESRFRPDVKSNAAARGLMQFISTTSRRIAAELGRQNFEQDELYDPSTAILFGSVYVGELYRMFPNQHAAVAASYNGGEDNMRRWLGRAKASDSDAYVAEIAYAQTKDYVRKVLANYRVYTTLYDEQLRVRSAATERTE